MGQVKALRRSPSIGGVPIDEVFDRHHADVYRYLARRVPADVAEDLASETFVQAVTRGHTFDPERGALREWIFGIASNLLSRHHREEVRAYRAWARTGVDPLVTAGDETDRAIDRVDSQSRGPALVTALADLSDGDRDVLLLVAHAGLTYAEVAQALDLPVGTVRSRLNRAAASCGPRSTTPRGPTMTTDEIGLLDGPEMDALRELRADVPGPTQAQRQAAWERVQGARSHAEPRRRKGGRAWLLAGAAAVAAAVVVGGVVVATGGPESAPPATGSDQSTSAAPTSPNPTPFATGSVWEPVDATERKVIEGYRKGIALTPEGGVRIEIPETMNWEAMTKATNAEGIPVRFWAVSGTTNAWEIGGTMTIDPEDGVDMAAEPGEPYPSDGVFFERSGGKDSPVAAVVFDHVPTEPVDINFTQ